MGFSFEDDMKEKYSVIFNLFLYISFCVENINKSLELMGRFNLEVMLFGFRYKVYDYG